VTVELWFDSKPFFIGNKEQDGFMLIFYNFLEPLENFNVLSASITF
jgi:hypothetical protein